MGVDEPRDGELAACIEPLFASGGGTSCAEVIAAMMPFSIKISLTWGAASKAVRTFAPVTKSLRAAAIPCGPHKMLMGNLAIPAACRVAIRLM